MALITNKAANTKTKVKAQIDAHVAHEIQRYCEWVDVDMSFFFEEAARFVFAKDKEWKALNKKQGLRGRKPASQDQTQAA